METDSWSSYPEVKKQEVKQLLLYNSSDYDEQVISEFESTLFYEIFYLASTCFIPTVGETSEG